MIWTGNTWQHMCSFGHFVGIKLGQSWDNHLQDDVNIYIYLFIDYIYIRSTLFEKWYFLKRRNAIINNHHNFEPQSWWHYVDVFFPQNWHSTNYGQLILSLSLIYCYSSPLDFGTIVFQYFVRKNKHVKSDQTWSLCFINPSEHYLSCWGLTFNHV